MNGDEKQEIHTHIARSTCVISVAEAANIGPGSLRPALGSTNGFAKGGCFHMAGDDLLPLVDECRRGLGCSVHSDIQHSKCEALWHDGRGRLPRA